MNDNKKLDILSEEYVTTSKVELHKFNYFSTFLFFFVFYLTIGSYCRKYLKFGFIILIFSSFSTMAAEKNYFYEIINRHLHSEKIDSMSFCIVESTTDKIPILDFPDMNAKKDFERSIFRADACTNTDNVKELELISAYTKKILLSPAKQQCGDKIPFVFIKITSWNHKLWLSAYELENELCFDVYGEDFGREATIISIDDIGSIVSPYFRNNPVYINHKIFNRRTK